jgi:hypothetical protein
MTRKTRALRKLGNAVRAFHGGQYTQPKKKAKSRVDLWAARCKVAGWL